jgi:hypothetical protein
MLPFPLDQANDDVRVIPSEIFEPASRLSELQDLFFLSYHPGLELPDQIAPIVRRGMVSFFKDDGTFYMYAFIKSPQDTPQLAEGRNASFSGLFFHEDAPSLLGGNSFRSRHSLETGDPARKDWIPGQARNDNLRKGTSDALH